MCVDSLRSHNISPTRLVSGSGQVFWVRWYPTKPGAKPLGLWTAFGHPVWEDRPNEFEGPGMLLEGSVWRPKKYPAPPGLEYHGQPSWFQDGLPANWRSYPAGPLCYGAEPILPEGGLELGGNAETASGLPSTRGVLVSGLEGPTGGVLVGGVQGDIGGVITALPSVPTTTGGVLVGGEQLGVGGVLVGGEQLGVGGVLVAGEQIDVGGVVLAGEQLGVGGVLVGGEQIDVGGVLVGGVQIDVGGVVVKGIDTLAPGATGGVVVKGIDTLAPGATGGVVVKGIDTLAPGATGGVVVGGVDTLAPGATGGVVVGGVDTHPGVSTSCCSVPVKTTLTMTVTVLSGTITVPAAHTLTYNATFNEWRATQTWCGSSRIEHLKCISTGPGFRWDITIGTLPGTGGPNTSDCGPPLHLVWNSVNLFFDMSCNGNVKIDVKAT